ncbi:hypothetical protein C5167_037884 [Papaver somniferum]|uniref:glycerophosphodiester phosphodiesterase n=1 Tax=Papaver somniferum TaxID=3469 RepID=A0A4Y7IA77_PAPSO|nr:hypothetical protein C5167_037884 [Papaver somniferum]
MKSVKENSILSFNKAADYVVDYVEFDVQVTKDNVPVIFHDDEIITGKENNDMYMTISERKFAEITLDGWKICKWNVENDDSLCTLHEAFQNVNSSLGFNIELKLDDYFVYQDEQLVDRLCEILRVVLGYAKERPVIFSTFLMQQGLSGRGTETYTDVRRNSLDEVVKLCLENGLQGIVSDVRGVLVEFVGEISEVVSDLIKPVKEEEERISFTQCKFSFLQNLVSELTQH